jgi:hypothetical protein
MANTLENIIKKFDKDNEINLQSFVYSRVREYDREIKREKITLEKVIESLEKEDKLRPFRNTSDWKEIKKEIAELF